MFFNCFTFIFYHILLACNVADGQIRLRPTPVTSTTTITSWTWVTLTFTTTTADICAKLINVTQPCRQRRGKWVEDPAILTFDEGMEQIDLLLDPTAIQSVVPTESAKNEREKRSEIESSVEQDSSNGRIFLNQLSQIMNQLRRTVTITSTQASTRTVSSLVPVFSTTKTFFIQFCTPSPFPYNTC